MALRAPGIPPYFSDAEREELDRNPQFRNITVCPTCGGRGFYDFRDERIDCPVDDYGHIQMRMFKLYTLANIPLQYQKLDWATFRHTAEKQEIDRYLTEFEIEKQKGKGWEISGRRMGTGKTFAATYMLRQIVKMGYDGWFADFLQVKSYFEISDDDRRDFLVKKVHDTDVLVLDEVRKPWSEAQRNFFADVLEELIRYRTNMNLVTITTTNMVEREMVEEFPRVYSLLSAKQHRMCLDGDDARTEYIYDDLDALGTAPIL